jgi:hypothetical protein
MHPLTIKPLFAPTARMVDYSVSGEALSTLIRALTSNESSRDALYSAINEGPPTGQSIWERPQTPLELVASLVRWTALGRGEKKRIRVDDTLRAWIKNTLEKDTLDLRPRMGGVSAVGALTSRALGHNPTMMALGKLPPDVASLVGGGIAVVGDDPSHAAIEELPRDNNAVGNFGFFAIEHALSVKEELPECLLDGNPLETLKLYSLDCLVTGSSSVPGFTGLSPARMRSLGFEHDLIVLTGVQNLAGSESIKSYCGAITHAREGNPLMAWLYSESKAPEFELQALQALRESSCIDFLGINAVEARALLQKIAVDSRTTDTLALSSKTIEELSLVAPQANEHDDTWGSRTESPNIILQSALTLHSILGIPIVRVRGRRVDLTIISNDLDLPTPVVEDLKHHLTASRLLGVIKTAVSSGLITESRHVTQLFNFPEGQTLAALQVLEDSLIQRYGRRVDGRISHNFTARLPDGRTIIATPPLSFFDKSGGTVSAGDVIDVSFLVESAAQLRDQLRLPIRPRNPSPIAPQCGCEASLPVAHS